MTFNFERRAVLQGTAAALAGAFAGRGAEAQSRPSDVLATAAGLEQLHALIVRQDGQTRIAEAFRGWSLEQPANVKSVSKTIVALLTGIAIDKGILTGPDQRILPLLGHPATGDQRDALTIGNLLSMQAGLESTSGPNYGAWVSSGDWVEYVLSRPADSPPGGRFIYSTGGWHVLGAALARSSGESLHALAQGWLGDPLDIRIPPWITDPQGRFLGGNDMAISPLDLARIGDMVLNRGQIDGRRVVGEGWLDTSFRPRTRSPFSGDAYGYGWFLTRFGGTQAVYARGYGGQMLVVVPDRRLTITILSDLNRPARGDGYFGDLRNLAGDIVSTY
ncbi:serine hydrolase domain-containing protein [Tropicimonas sp.]|uniref:serine hydrolase domain-containing protein n=1 Tax=Tropicimonas sp. TaxID=2067044 RepID=UPI003A87C9F5